MNYNVNTADYRRKSLVIPCHMLTSTNLETKVLRLITRPSDAIYVLVIM
jgi:hypothetical protein